MKRIKNCKYMPSSRNSSRTVRAPRAALRIANFISKVERKVSASVGLKREVQVTRAYFASA